MRTPLIVALTLTCLCACASGSGAIYSAPPGVSNETLEADRNACVEESGITRLGNDQKLLEQQCMMTRGYHVESKPQ